MSNATLINGRRLGAHTSLSVLLSAAKDRSGRTWPAGTEYTVACAGYDNARGVRYQKVRIDGQDVVFEA